MPHSDGWAAGDGGARRGKRAVGMTRAKLKKVDKGMTFADTGHMDKPCPLSKNKENYEKT